MPHDVTDAYGKHLFELWAERAEKLILEISLEKPNILLEMGIEDNAKR